MTEHDMKSNEIGRLNMKNIKGTAFIVENMNLKEEL